MTDTYVVTIGGVDYDVDANSPWEAKAKAEAYAASTHTGAAQKPPPQVQPAHGEGPPTQPISKFQQPIDIGVPRSPLSGPMSLPSPERMTEWLPALGGLIGLGATGGTPPGAAAGAATGELARQAIRAYAGEPQATGLTQRLAGLDPNSPEAAALGVGAEAAGAGLGEKAFGFLADKVAPYLKEAALKTYAGIFAPKNEVIAEKLVDKLRPLVDAAEQGKGIDLPMGMRGRINRIATEQAGQANAVVGDVYGQPIPASFKPAEQALRDLTNKPPILNRAAHEVASIDPKTGTVTMVPVEATYHQPKLAAKLTDRADELAKKESAGLTSGQPITITDLFNARRAADATVTEKGFKLGTKTASLTPAVQAAKAERSALADTLHKTVGLPAIEADQIAHGWMTVQSETGGSGLMNWLGRWMTARAIPGIGGTVTGSLLARPALWRSMGYKTMSGVANALRAGDEVGASQILRGAIDDYVAQHPEQQSSPETQP